MNEKYRVTLKDIILVTLFIGLVVLNIVYHIDTSGFNSVSTMIEQTILIMLSFVGLVQISSNIGWNIFVPDFYAFALNQRSKGEAQKYMGAYFKEDVKFLHNYAKDRIRFLTTQLGVNEEQLSKIRLDLIRMRCMPLENLKHAEEKMKYLVTGDYPAIINQKEIDSSKLSYNKVQYFINITDMMFLEDYAREFSSILSFLITEKADLSAVDKLVIPYDSNFLLGVETGKRLGKPVVKMRSERGKIEAEKCWDGNLNSNDKVLIIHDVLVTADQIIKTLNKLPETCQVIGLYCLIVRKEWDGKNKLMQKNISVNQIIDLDDNDIREIRGDK